MENNFILDNIIKDFVTSAFFESYPPDKLKDLGLKIDANYSNRKVRSIGTEPNIFFPEIVIWKPSTELSNNGTAVLIGIVETNSSLKSPDLMKWKKLSQIPNVVFCLIAPKTNISSIIELIARSQITNVNIYSYYYNSTEKKYVIESQ